MTPKIDSKVIGNLIRFALACLLLSCSTSENKLEGIMVNEDIEWSSTWIVNTNDTVLPKVLIIGDSHVERYYGLVATKLGKNFSCSKFTTSKSLGDPVFIKQLESVLMLGNFDIISFNNGLHGADYKLEEYSKFAHVAYAMLKNNAKKSVLWVNSTAIREPENINMFNVRNQQIIERNKFVTEFAESNQIPLVDFYSATANNLEYYSEDGVHFNEAGVEMEAELITKKIKEIIPN
jgi:hypothetical protein